MFERFTEKAIKTIMLAQEEARRLGHNFVGTEMILLGLIGEGSDIASQCLRACGVTLKQARLEVEQIIGRGNSIVALEIPFTPRAKLLLETSWKHSSSQKVNYIDSGHLLLGLLDTPGGVATRVLENMGVDKHALRGQIHIVQSARGKYERPAAPGFRWKHNWLLQAHLSVFIAAGIISMYEPAAGLGLALVWGVSSLSIVVGTGFPSSSMYPTIHGDCLLTLERISSKLGLPPRTGDIVAFTPPESMRAEIIVLLKKIPPEAKFGTLPKTTVLLRRVIARPGDTVKISDGEVYVNSRHLHPTWKTAGRPACDMDEIVVPADSYFVLGDSYSNSIDSRSFGCIQKKSVLGRIILIKHHKKPERDPSSGPTQNYDAILDYYNKELNRNPTAEMYCARGSIYAQLKREQEAIEDYNRAIGLSPDDPALHFELASAFLSMRQFDQALNHADETIKLDPEYISAYSARAMIFLGLNRLEDALNTFREAIARRPDDLLLHLNHTFVLILLARYEEALASTNNNFVQTVGSHYAYQMRATILTRLNRFSEAAEEANTALLLAPRDSDGYVVKSLLYLRLKQLDLAEEQAQLALDQQGGHQWFAQWSMGTVRFYQGDYTGAADWANKGIGSQPFERRPLSLYARAKAALGEFDEAESNIATAFQCGPVDSGMYALRAEIRNRQNLLEPALEDINKSLAIDSFSREAYELRASILRKLGRDEDAEADEKRAKV